MSIMFSLWSNRKHPFKAHPEYSRVNGVGGSKIGRESSDGSQDGLLEKEIQEIYRKTSFWRRHASILVLNFIIFGIYVATLAAVASYVPKECLQGPNLLHCEFAPFLSKPCAVAK